MELAVKMALEHVISHSLHHWPVLIC